VVVGLGVVVVPVVGGSSGGGGSGDTCISESVSLVVSNQIF